MWSGWLWWCGWSWGTCAPIRRLSPLSDARVENGHIEQNKLSPYPASTQICDKLTTNQTQVRVATRLRLRAAQERQGTRQGARCHRPPALYSLVVEWLREPDVSRVPHAQLVDSARGSGLRGGRDGRRPYRIDDLVCSMVKWCVSDGIMSNDTLQHVVHQCTQPNQIYGSSRAAYGTQNM